MTQYKLPDVVTRNIQGRGPTTVWEFECSDCGQVFDIPKPIMRCTGKESPKDIKTIMRRLDAAGWTYKKHFRSLMCSGCAAKQKAAQQQAMKDNVIMINKPVQSVSPTPSPAKPEPPRSIIRDARRRIADLLEAVYDAKAEVYQGDESDESVAKTLGYPRAWVTEVRAMMFGDHDRNESQARMDSEILELEKSLAAVKADMLERIAGIEGDLKRLRTRGCAA